MINFALREGIFSFLFFFLGKLHRDNGATLDLINYKVYVEQGTGGAVLGIIFVIHSQERVVFF